MESLKKFYIRQINDTMPHFSGYLTILRDHRLNLKQIEKELLFIKEIDKKQGKEEPLTTEQEIFSNYFYMVSELSTMRQILNKMQNMIWYLNERDTLKLQHYWEMRDSAWWSWFRNRWTTTFLKKSSRDRYQQLNHQAKYLEFRVDEFDSKMRELQNDKTNFLKSHEHENTDLRNIYWDLIKKMEDHTKKLNDQKLKSEFSEKVDDIRDFLMLPEKKQNHNLIELKLIFDELVPEFTKIHDSYTSFEKRCRAQTDINQKQMENDDEVVALYQFCERNHKAFPGIQNEGDEEIPIPPKGERTDENMLNYLVRREKAEWLRINELERIEQERKMKEASSK